MSFLAKNKKLFWLLIYFILVTVIFLFLNFPSESVKAYVQSLAEDKMKESDFFPGKGILVPSLRVQAPPGRIGV